MPDAASRLAACALDLAERQGFVETSVREIAEAAGVTERTFYRHFARKELALFPDRSSLLRAAETFQTDLREVEPAVREALHAVVDARRDESELWRRRYRVIDACAELAAFERSLDGELIELLTGRFAELQPGRPERAARLRARAVAAMITVSTTDLLRTAAQGGSVCDDIAELARLARICLDEHTPAPAGVVMIAVADLPDSTRRDLEGSVRRALDHTVAQSPGD